MKKTRIKPIVKKILADTITPVSIYMGLRDIFQQSLLLESSDYHSVEDSYSFICLEPAASFVVDHSKIMIRVPGQAWTTEEIKDNASIPERLHRFLKSFDYRNNNDQIRTNGLFGYSAFDAVRYFEDIHPDHNHDKPYAIPDMVYSVYRYIIAINHFQNVLYIIENVIDDSPGRLEYIESLLSNRNFATYPFSLSGKEQSNLTDSEYMKLVTKGKEHCHRGDVFQIVLSRQFSQAFKGDEFNVYRCLRSINPSPYLFYFDYGNYRLFGSSPEALLQVNSGTAAIYPIAGTFKRTGDAEKDQELAFMLSHDKKENSEHVMLVDLARNDLSRNAANVKVEKFREIQYFSHVIHMVSKVTGKLPQDFNPVRVFADSFPAGTLSGAPKYKAMELINRYENQERGYYGGGLGYFGFNDDVNHAIMIRSFLSKDNHLYYQAGAGIVADSVEQTELQEVNNKLMALKRAIQMAKNL
jgi:anthranilate synthase component 1